MFLKFWSTALESEIQGQMNVIDVIHGLEHPLYDVLL